MRLPPMIASLTRHKLTVLLMLLATAFTCAIVTNIASMVAHRLALLDAPSGIDESAVVLIDSDWIKTTQFGNESDRDLWPEYQADLRALRGITHVESATTVDGMPFWGGGLSLGIGVSAEEATTAPVYASAFKGGPGVIETMGLKLLHGKDFSRADYVHGKHGQVAAAIISRALAERLFHTSDAVGRLIYTHALNPIRVVGVVAHLMITSPGLGAADNEYAMLWPAELGGDSVTFALRTAPAERTQVLKRAVALLSERNPHRIFHNAETFTQSRAKYFRRYSSMIDLLLATGFGLLLVTAAGMAGLTSFWVQQRTRSIGIRRALGATRVDILRYTHVENFLIVTVGILFGCALAYGLNLQLMKYYALQTLPPAYLGIGAVALWLMGQLAVLAPSLRAGAVPPAVATRSG
ncbi:MAG TPA: FtsX-like permease family protein [Rhodanobacteraceae bacterium]|nr:FtsX-like permease family protein [Rhodanobacteraceae bacterium]